MVASAAMRTELLVLLDDRRAKAAVAWQFVTRHAKPKALDREHLLEAFDDCWYCPDEWMALAGLSKRDHPHVAPFLFKTDAVGPDGSVSEEALAYARRMTASQILAGPKRKREG